MMIVNSLVSYFGQNNKLKLFSFIFLGLLCGMTGCVDFDTYSDSNEVIGIHAGIVSSDYVFIDKQELLSANEGRIVLRVKGELEESLPLTVDAEFELSPQSKILYSEKYSQFVFHSLRDSFSFQVIAQSGLPKKWTVSLKDARSADGDIVDFRVKSYQADADAKDLVATAARLYKLKDTSLVEVFVNTGSDSIFPIKVTPEIRVSENGHFVNYNMGDPLVFQSLQSVCNLKVEAENKSIRDWRVVLRTPDSDEVNLKSGSFLLLSDCLDVNDNNFAVDTAEADALVKVDQVKDWKNFSVLMQYELKLPLGAKMVLLDGETPDFSGKRVIFNRIEEVRKFKIVSQSGKEKIWKMRLGYTYSDLASVESFSYSSWRPQGTINLSLDPEAVNPLLSTIYINVNSGVKNITAATPLYIMPVLKLSDKASINGLEAEVGGVYRLPEIAFTGINDVYRFKILSESYKEYEWKIVLVDKQKDKDAAADVESILLNLDKLPAGVSFDGDIFTANKATREIVLKLQSVKFPFLLDAAAYSVSVSEKAKLLDKGQALLFEDIGDRKSLRVEAENGTEKAWTVRLDYKKNAGADIRELKINQIFPSDIAYEKTGTVDAEKAEVTLQVTDANGSFPLRLDVGVTVSDRARIEPELKSLVFAGENSVVKVHVIAESGISREWAIRLKNQTVKNDLAEVTAFKAESLNPDIETGTPVKQGETIQVPVLAGKNKFPLSLDINKTTVSAGATLSKVILTFDKIGRNEIFNVTSQNGKIIKQYQVTLVDQVKPNSQADITAVSFERYDPVTYELSKDVTFSGENKILVKLYGGFNSKLTLWPVMTVSEGAKLQTTVPATGIVFNTAGDVAKFTVLAEDGTTRKEWTMGIEQAERLKSPEAVIEEVAASNSDNIVVNPLIKANNEVTLFLGNSQPKYPFTVKTELSVSPNAKVEVVNKNLKVNRLSRQTRASDQIQVIQVIELVFNSPADRYEVKVTSEDGTANNSYSFALGGAKVANTEANVVEYKLESYYPLNMSEAPLIFAPDTAQGIITVNAPSEEEFPFTIYTRMRVSYNAEVKGIDPAMMKFERGFAGKDFEVVSESGRVKKWKLVMKVAEKSKENNVTAFTVSEYSPLSAGLGKPEIRTAERKIVIPVKDWVKGERLTLTANIELSAKATTDFRTNLFFQTAKDEYVFNVTAQNGNVAEWKVVLDYTFSNQANITSCRILSGEPSTVTYNADAVIDNKTNTVYIDVLENLTFPFTVTANMAYSAKTEVDAGGMAGNKIRFDKYQDSTVIRVTAEDEVTRKDWKVKLRYHFSEEADITGFKIMASQPAGVILNTPSTEISSADRTIWVNIADWGGMTNLQITPALTISDKATHNLTGDLLFVKKTSETKTINVTAESGRVAPWSVKLRYQESSAADITKVTYGQWEPAGINFIGATVDAKTATVTLELQTWNGETSFTLKGIQCTLSDKATASIPVEMTFKKRLQESLEYTVKAQDGTEKKWTFKLLYHESNAAEITRFRVTGNSQPGIISMATTGVISDGVISIDLNSGVRDAFESGFQINVEAEISAKATANIPSVITFSKPSDVRRYTVTSESGLAKEWTVKFVNNASKDASLLAIRGAAITGGTTSLLGDLKCSDFKVSGNTAGMTITDVISLNKYDRNWPTLNINLDLQLSARAKVREGNMVSVNVGNPGVKTLTVVADDGEHQQTYNLEVAYKPQLENGNLDSWSDGKTPGSSLWGTANNTFVSGTSQTSGKSGSAAYLKTSEAVGMKAAGTVFLGYFKFTSLTDALSDPEKMTYFGVAFPARPKQLKVDIQYRPGSGTLNDGTGDKGHVWVALEYWPDPNNPKNPNNKRYAYGEVKIGQVVGSWTTYTITIDVVNAGVTPTHILFVAASSYDGNHFNAVVGSEMKVDNVELVY